MNISKITQIILIGLVSLTLIATMAMMENAKAQVTDFEALFDKPEYQLCRQSIDDTTSSDPAEWTSKEICDVSIIDVTFQSNNTMTLWLRHPGYSGPALDEINKAGYHVEAVIPDNTADSPSALMYFTR